MTGPGGAVGCEVVLSAQFAAGDSGLVFRIHGDVKESLEHSGDVPVSFLLADPGALFGVGLKRAEVGELVASRPMCCAAALRSTSWASRVAHASTGTGHRPRVG